MAFSNDNVNVIFINVVTIVLISNFDSNVFVVGSIYAGIVNM